jgi:hypothetical protein
VCAPIICCANFFTAGDDDDASASLDVAISNASLAAAVLAKPWPPGTDVAAGGSVADVSFAAMAVEVLLAESFVDSARLPQAASPSVAADKAAMVDSLMLLSFQS